MKKLVLALLTVASIMTLVVACGGGGGGGETVEICIQERDEWQAETLNPPTSSNLVDTYTLIGFEIDVWEDGVFLGTVDETWAMSFSGTMVIQPTTISQTITIDGSTLAVSGTYTVTVYSPISGTFHFVDQSGAHDADFTISGNVLTTDSGLLCETVPVNQSGSESLQSDGEGSMGSLVHRVVH